MALNARKRLFIRRMAGYGINPVQRRWRVMRSREQSHLIGGHPVTLPPAHDLPFYQDRDPTYDTYAGEVLAELAAHVDRMLVIDVGANVGDTAVEALAAAPNIEVVAVEGDPLFVSYARRNVEQFGARARVLEGFVGPVGSRVHFSTNGSTGGFQASEADGAAVTDWMTPASLLAETDSYGEVVWKSDIDGFDIHVLVHHWADIDAACQTLWFEFDPASTLGDRDDIVTLIELLADSGRQLRIFDNLGREMVRLAPGDPIRHGLTTLTNWLTEQRRGHLTVPYVDVWAR
ncbi:FkbM family methyltransferase [Nocardioides alpinus]|uniref:FkbM family methyltransferase n=1 Tax=Nocardioides alpinus TaxID=748909 RepID=UPI000B83D002|nr:FkbM family methyltransferase [Nocardioides alpinus]